jgi:hypothetical protein
LRVDDNFPDLVAGSKVHGAGALQSPMRNPGETRLSASRPEVGRTLRPDLLAN